MSDARPINVRVFACPDVLGEWCAVCPEYDVVAQDASRPKALAMLADFVAMVETGDAMNGRDPFARASLSDDTVSVYAAMLRDVTAALRRPGDKAASPEACAMLREALDGLDDALENIDPEHRVNRALHPERIAERALRSAMASPRWLPEWPSAFVKDAEACYYGGPQDTLFRVTVFLRATAVDAATINAIEDVIVDEIGGARVLNDEGDIVRKTAGVRAKPDPEFRDEEAKAALASDVRWRPFLLRVAPEWVPPDGCKITSRLGDIVSCTLTPSALAACEADPAVLIAEESTDKCHNGTEDD